MNPKTAHRFQCAATFVRARVDLFMEDGAFYGKEVLIPRALDMNQSTLARTVDIMLERADLYEFVFGVH